MIIGISGKKQHGKDTVANIIQYLAFDKRYPGHSHTLQTFSRDTIGWKNLESTWYRKQFASKLKQVVAILIGCTIEDLEDNNFKETPLSSEWTVFYLVDGKYNTRIGKLYTTHDELEYSLNSIQKSCLQTKEFYLLEERLTPRKLLQLVGTEGGRDLIHPNLWVNALMNDYRLETKFTPAIVEPNWIVTDTRFINEAEAIIKRKGIVIHINRTHRTSDRWQEMFPAVKVIDPDGWNRLDWEYSWFHEFITLEEYRNRIMMSTCYVDKEFKGTTAKSIDKYFHPDEHESETALDNYNSFSAIITNDGNFDSLVRQVKNIITNLNIFQLP